MSDYLRDSASAIDCWWSIETVPDRILLVEAIDMVLEEGVDLIQIYDGPSKSSLALIGNYSSGNSVVVHFSSKSASSVKNFQLKLQKVRPPQMFICDIFMNESIVC